jgi:apolipoprotein N-acyltransferase
MTWYKNNGILHWIVAGLLLGVGFVVPLLWWFGVVGIAGVIYLALHEPSLKRLALGGLLAWTIKSALALIWFWSVYPIDWVGVDLGYLQLVLIFFWWITASVWLGFGGIVFALICLLLKQKTQPAIMYIAIPFVWILAELLGSLAFSVITIGPGGSITTAFSFGYVGYLLANHPILIQVAQIAGVYSLGVLAVAIAVLVVYLFEKPVYRRYSYGLFALLILTSFISPAILPSQSTNKTDKYYTVAIIDTTFTIKDLRTENGVQDRQEQLELAIKRALELAPDYIILPEDSRYFDQQNEANFVAKQFAFLHDTPQVVVVDSGRAEDSDQSVVQSFVYNGDEKAVEQSQKRYLVPQGEFMPTLYKSALKLFGKDEVVERFAKTVAYQVGSNTSQSNFASTTPGVLFCFESVSPWGVRTVLNERGSVPFVAHPVSHAWFHHPKTLWSQLDTMLRVQAIWTQQYIVSAGNMASGFMITSTGTLVRQAPIASGEKWNIALYHIPQY